MNMKNRIYILVIIIVIILTLIFTVSFAFVNKPIIGQSINEDEETLKLIAMGDVNISLSITEEELSKSIPNNDYSSYISKGGKVVVNLNTSEKIYPNGVTCGFEMKYFPITSYSSSVGALKRGLKELTISGSSGDKMFNDIILDNATTAQTLYTSSISTSVSENVVNQNWNITMKFYNLNIDQSEAIGQTPKGQIVIDAIDCEANV